MVLAASLYRMAIEQIQSPGWMPNFSGLHLDTWKMKLGRIDEILQKHEGNKEWANRDAKFKLAVIYHYRNNASALDISRAVHLYRSAAELGHPDAMGNLGYLLRYGADGVNRDPTAARKSLEEALEAGNRLSGVQLADMLLTGDAGHTHKNPSKAVHILEQVLTTGSSPLAPAAHELAVLLGRGDGDVQEALIQSAKLHLTAVQDGSYEECFYAEPAEAVAKKVISAGVHYPKDIDQALSHAVSTPKKCLLLTLGGGGRGKTCKVNSIRGLPFIEEHIPTQMTAFSEFVADPGNQHLEKDLLSEIDFSDCALEAAASRIDSVNSSRFIEDHPLSDLDRRSRPSTRSFPQPSLEESVEIIKRNKSHPHADVTERIRRSMVHAYFPRGFSGGVVQVWDMAGQMEYEMAHSLFIEQADIIIFVTDLARIWNEQTRQAEVKLLCHWMQIAYILLREPEKTTPVIVGTRRAECSIGVDILIRMLRRYLADELSDSVYKNWITAKDNDPSSNIIALEKKDAIDNRESSGIVELEKAIKSAADRVVELRGEVPVRWLAFVDKLHRQKSTFFTRDHIREMSVEFPGFTRDEDEREQDVLKGLKTFASMGKLVFFQVSPHEWCVFTDVERIVNLVGMTANPMETLQKYLDPKDIRGLSRGVISEKALFKLWGERDEEEKVVMLKLLIQFDLLMHLRDDLLDKTIIGVPALYAEGWEDFKWRRGRSDRDLHVTTNFEVGIPVGLMGKLFSRLHKAIGGVIPPKSPIRADATLVSVPGLGRFFVMFKRAERELTWVFRGKDPHHLARRSLHQVEKLFDELKVARLGANMSHFVPMNCEPSEGGCGEEASVSIRLSQE